MPSPAEYNKRCGGTGTKRVAPTEYQVVWYGGTMGASFPTRCFTGRGACVLRRGEGTPPYG
nr:MAG TPA: hypothetical protein [Caudoviricetes sp.]